ncbi:peptidoglycan recognition protein family protein [Bradyrhizobium sp.]|uniref:peptidoglycan recognition protein family protein n=1 Tax=Bradyrhizobium sp. TaxID=376 RepID=UPI002CF6E2C3|nr:peptidoglycan recognition family protein [Bradyrhizobium sp.]HMM88022.1 peptidoglycan recognition family protein [Bradyrhizobium sp.]
MLERNRRGRQGAAFRRTHALLCLVVLASLGSSGSAAEKLETSRILESTIVDDLAPFVPDILDRAGWKAKSALPGMKEQKPGAIILHHTGVQQNSGVALDAKLRGLQSFSQRPGHVSPTRTKPAWPDVPYHYYVDHAGRIAEGREVQYAGDTNTGYDTTNYIQVVVEGDFEHEAPAPEQMAALRKVLVWLMLAWSIPPGKISTHKDYAPTTCPGRNFVTMLPEVLALATTDRTKAISGICAGSPSDQFFSIYCVAR